MTAYYNEIDPYAAQWLRNLIEAGHIAPGIVDERSIEDVRAGDLAGFTQCHFFAGIGVWSYALRRAGWHDDRPVWSGSCPCQPFSQAGEGSGFDDVRHLWPTWFQLIAQCRPSAVYGEQVASPNGLTWLDLVQGDMERAEYAFAAVDICAASVGAPHIRQRIYFNGMADSDNTRLERRQRMPECSDKRFVGAHSLVSSVAHPNTNGRQSGNALRSVCPEPNAKHGFSTGNMADANGIFSTQGGTFDRRSYPGSDAFERSRPGSNGIANGAPGVSNPVNVLWDRADWLNCRDGNFRPVEPGTFPLANGAPSRMGRLRAYGNAIVAQVAEEVIRATMDFEG